MACSSCAARERSSTTRDCSNLTVEDLQVFKEVYQCVLANGQWLQAGLQENQVNDRISQLIMAIANKTADQNSCLFYDYLDIFTQEVTNIIVNTDCT